MTAIAKPNCYTRFVIDHNEINYHGKNAGHLRLLIMKVGNRVPRLH